MIIYFNPYLKNLEQEILNNEDITSINPIILKEFKKSINKVTPKNWEEIESLFKTNIEYLFTYEEQIVFSIIAINLGLPFLEKDPTLTSNVIKLLIELNKSPLNYTKYIQIFITEPLYSSILNITDIISQHELLKLIFLKNLEKPEIKESNYNELIKSLYKIKNQKYYIFIKKTDSLNTIYNKLYTYIKNNNNLINKLHLINLLNILLNIIKDNNEEIINNIKNDFLQIDENNYTKKDIIKEILQYLEKLDITNNFIRRRYHA